MEPSISHRRQILSLRAWLREDHGGTGWKPCGELGAGVCLATNAAEGQVCWPPQEKGHFIPPRLTPSMVQSLPVHPSQLELNVSWKSTADLGAATERDCSHKSMTVRRTGASQLSHFTAIMTSQGKTSVGKIPAIGQKTACCSTTATTALVICCSDHSDRMRYSDKRTQRTVRQYHKRDLS